MDKATKAINAIKLRAMFLFHRTTPISGLNIVQCLTAKRLSAASAVVLDCPFYALHPPFPSSFASSPSFISTEPESRRYHTCKNAFLLYEYGGDSSRQKARQTCCSRRLVELSGIPFQEDWEKHSLSRAIYVSIIKGRWGDGII